MINLLPTGIKSDLMYARRNTVLFRWIIATLLVLAGVGAIVLAGNLYIQYSIRNYSSQITQSKQELQAQQIDETQQKIDEISGNTKLALDVLSKEILFSKLLVQLGASIPQNTVLEQFQVEEIGGGLTLQAAATDINAATQLQVNLQDPANKIFKSADIESINCTPEEDTKYPCSVQIRALFADKNEFTFIGEKGSNR